MRYRRAARLCLAVTLLAAAGCATRPATPSAHTWERPCDDCIAGVPNLSRVSEKLWRSAQPDPHDPAVYRRLAAQGVKTVISLRHDYDDFPALADTKIDYVRIPMRAFRPREEDMVLLLATLRRALADPQRWPVLVHCEDGKDRTGYAIATYRIVEQGWDAESAIQEMFDFHYNPLYFRTPSFLRRMSERRADIAARVARTP